MKKHLLIVPLFVLALAGCGVDTESSSSSVQSSSQITSSSKSSSAQEESSSSEEISSEEISSSEPASKNPKTAAEALAIVIRDFGASNAEGYLLASYPDQPMGGTDAFKANVKIDGDMWYCPSYAFGHSGVIDDVRNEPLYHAIYNNVEYIAYPRGNNDAIPYVLSESPIYNKPQTDYNLDLISQESLGISLVEQFNALEDKFSFSNEKLILNETIRTDNFYGAPGSISSIVFSFEEGKLKQVDYRAVFNMWSSDSWNVSGKIVIESYGNTVVERPWNYDSDTGIIYNKTNTKLFCTSNKAIAGAVQIPNTVTSIYQDAFRDCNKLVTVVIPNSVTTISSSAFNNCTSLSTISYQGTISQWNNIDIYGEWLLNTLVTSIHCTDGDVDLLAA